ncbi:hypothetical protein CLV59_105307 [Chitinophaga dinghuensis]|uniref:Uncharacterized protein n=1 Tax=Chitinophaga dinghuensis TaxID=1539050 RepID=A0A327VW81_9BACT|nr:DUF6138 family protein [Chitinophaga dinghuensis]RAJ80199.1 hypothetical protein CLV59_105307 [Chitinophaga dinghuensis]
MNKEQETIAKDIAQAISSLIEKLNAKVDAATVVKRTTLQAGVFDFVRFEYKDGDIYLYSTDDDFSDADMHLEGIAVPGALTTPADVASLAQVLHEHLYPIIAAYDQLPILDYKLVVYGEILVGQTRVHIPEYVHISTSKKQLLQRNIQTYLNERVTNGNHPTKELESFFLSRHLLDETLRGPLEMPVIKSVFDKIQQLNKANKDGLKQHRYHQIKALRSWAEKQFLPTYYDISSNLFQGTTYTLKAAHPAASASLLELLLYTTVMMIRYEPNYTRPVGVRFAEIAGELGNTSAATLLHSGTGAYAPLKTDVVAIKANDILAVVEIHILQETADAYAQALQYLTQLLQQEFPRSYAIKLKSKVKQLLDIKKLGKKDTQRFFANALQYPTLYPLLEAYARVAFAEKFEWYTDVEDELCTMPGTYAVFGLGLTDDTWFPLVRDYMKQVDSEHQSVQNQFTIAFTAKFGVHLPTIPTLVSCLLACQEMKPLKEFVAFEQPENLGQLLAALKEQPDYNVEHVIALIWGSKQKLATAAKKKDAPPALQQLLALAGK